MDPVQEIVEAPLSAEELALRYRGVCDDACLARVPGKIELDVWGRVMMTPPGSYEHAVVQGRLCQRLATLGRQTFGEVPVSTVQGIFVTDVAWGSTQFVARHRGETPLSQAPEICIEVASPSNSVKEFEEKIAAYLGAGAEEVWLVYPKSKRCEFYGKQGLIERSRFAVDLTGLFA